jgi:hypothetical protein
MKFLKLSKLIKMLNTLKYIIIFILSIGSYLQSNGQVAPSGILFQAVARDVNNSAAANRNVFVIVNVLEGAVTGASVYTESFQIVSTKEGVFSIIIGQGTRVSGGSSLLSLNWLNKTYYANIKIAIQPTFPELDWNPNNNYIDIGTTQFWSVPYAFTSYKAKFSDSALTINSILPGSKGGTGINNNDKTITLGNNIITKGIGDLTITTTAASSVIFPTSGTLATIKDISDLIKSDTVSLSKRIDTKLDSSQFPVLIAPFLQTISGMKYSDTSAMLSNRIARDTTSLNNRINLKADKLNAKIDSSLYINGKTTITDTLYAKANVLIDSNLYVKGGLRLGGKLQLDSGLVFKDSLIVSRGARIDSSLLVKGKIFVNDSLIVKGISLLSKLKIDSTVLSDNISKKLNISDTSGMLSSRIGRDTIALSNKINTKLNLSDTSGMLSS